MIAMGHSPSSTRRVNCIPQITYFHATFLFGTNYINQLVIEPVHSGFVSVVCETSRAKWSASNRLHRSIDQLARTLRKSPMGDRMNQPVIDTCRRGLRRWFQNSKAALFYPMSNVRQRTDRAWETGLPGKPPARRRTKHGLKA